MHSFAENAVGGVLNKARECLYLRVLLELWENGAKLHGGRRLSSVVVWRKGGDNEFSQTFYGGEYLGTHLLRKSLDDGVGLFG